MQQGAIATAAATALYVAPQFSSTFAKLAYARVSGPCIWAAIKKIDFEKYPTSGGGEAATTSGQRIDNEYSLWGLSVSTSRGTNHPAMIFDSRASNPPGGATHVTGGDHDLRTPSASGGHPLSESHSTNDKHLDKILIITEDNDANDPDDHAGGGEIYFDFAIPPVITYIDILDMDDGNSDTGSGRAKLWNGATFINGGGVVGSVADDNKYKFPPLGDNSWQRITIDPSDQVAVTRLEIEFNSSGAVAEIGFKCP